MQANLHSKGKSKGEILEAILYVEEVTAKGKGKGSSAGVEAEAPPPPPPDGHGGGAPPPPPPPPPGEVSEPEVVGRVLHEPKQMPKMPAAPKAAVPKQEEMASKGGGRKPPEPAKPPLTPPPSSARIPVEGHFESHLFDDRFL